MVLKLYEKDRKEKEILLCGLFLFGHSMLSKGFGTNIFSF